MSIRNAWLLIFLFRIPSTLGLDQVHFVRDFIPLLLIRIS